jgi:hypothetical protein
VARARAPAGVVTGAGGLDSRLHRHVQQIRNPHVRRLDVRLCVHVEVAPSRCGRRRGLRPDVNGAACAQRWSSTITSPSDAERASAANIDIMHACLQRCTHTPMLPTIVPTIMRTLVVKFRGVGGLIVCQVNRLLLPPLGDLDQRRDVAVVHGA